MINRSFVLSFCRDRLCLYSLLDLRNSILNNFSFMPEIIIFKNPFLYNLIDVKVI